MQWAGKNFVDGVEAKQLLFFSEVSIREKNIVNYLFRQAPNLAIVVAAGPFDKLFHLVSKRVAQEKLHPAFREWTLL